MDFHSVLKKILHLNRFNFDQWNPSENESPEIPWWTVKTEIHHLEISCWCQIPLQEDDDEFNGILGRYFSDFGMNLEHPPSRMTSCHPFFFYLFLLISIIKYIILGQMIDRTFFPESWFWGLNDKDKMTSDSGTLYIWILTVLILSQELPFYFFHNFPVFSNVYIISLQNFTV